MKDLVKKRWFFLGMILFIWGCSNLPVDLKTENQDLSTNPPDVITTQPQDSEICNINDFSNMRGDTYSVLNLADKTQYLFLQSRLQKAGKTLDDFPAFSRNSLSLDGKFNQTTRVTEEEVPFYIPDDYVINGDGEYFEVYAVSSVRKMATYCYVDLLVYDCNKNQISGLGFKEAYKKGDIVIAKTRVLNEKKYPYVIVVATEITDETGQRVARTLAAFRRVQYTIPIPTRTPVPTWVPTSIPVVTPSPIWTPALTLIPSPIYTPINTINSN